MAPLEPFSYNVTLDGGITGFRRRIPQSPPSNKLDAYLGFTFERVSLTVGTQYSKESERSQTGVVELWLYRR